MKGKDLPASLSIYIALSIYHLLGAETPLMNDGVSKVVTL